MLYFKELLQTLILYVLAVDFKRVLAITLPLDLRQQSVCYLTTTRELTTTTEELFTVTITLDRTGPLSTIESTSSI
jgi:hypothetical protein